MVKVLKVSTDVASFSYDKDIYGDLSGMLPDQHSDRFAKWWCWAQERGLHPVEYLFPRIDVATDINPFMTERRFIQERRRRPTKAEIDKVGPWAYQIEFGEVSTRDTRDEADWKYHRYRASLLVDTAATIAGDRSSQLTVLDVGCHCGIFSLEFAERGFQHVLGIDLRSQNIRQAQFLAGTFGSDGVDFLALNARDMTDRSADVVFCGGLLYHVTFPIELLRDLFYLTKEFLVLDSLCHREPVSAFHLVCNKDITYSAEGETSYEYHPTYRALGDALCAVGFKSIYEIVGDKAAEVPHYREGVVRSLVASKRTDGVFQEFLERFC
jgi:tRNA (mo5U34)-methyltransferase